MYQQTPIICNKCGKDTGFKAENFSCIVLTDDVKCPYCGEVLIYSNKAVCSSMAWGAESEE